MKKLAIQITSGIGILILLLAVPLPSTAQESAKKWISLFDGKTLNAWTASEHPETFSVEDGMIKVHGPRAHLFYLGPVNDSVLFANLKNNNNFKNFEFKADVKTTEGSNSGIYFHTGYQEEGWPAKGYEVQINNTHDDPRKTGSLYGIKDVMNNSPVDDGKWFTIYIKVQGNHITTKVNGETMVEYTEPEEVDREGPVLSSGTFALQGHDPGSTVYYKNIKVHILD